MAKLLKYVEGRNIESYFELYEFYQETLADEWCSRLENFSLTHVEFNGKQYFILAEMYEDTPTGIICEVVKTKCKETTYGASKEFKVRLFGEISDDWFGGTRNNTDKEKDKIVSQLRDLDFSEEIKKLKEENPCDFLECSGGDDEESDEDLEDDCEEGNDMHASLIAVKNQVCRGTNMSSDLFNFLTTVIGHIFKKLADEMHSIGYKDSKVHEGDSSDDSKLSFTIDEVQKMSKKEKRKLVMEEFGDVRGDAEEFLIAHIKELSLVEKLRSDIPKGLKPATVDHLRKAVKKVFVSEELSEHGITELDKVVKRYNETKSWKGTKLVFKESVLIKSLIENNIYPSKELVVGLAGAIEYIVAEIIEISNNKCCYAKSKVMGSTHAKCAILNDSDIKAMLSFLKDTELKVNDKTKLEEIKITVVNNKGKEWSESDSEALKAKEEEEEEEEEEEGEGEKEEEEEQEEEQEEEETEKVEENEEEDVEEEEEEEKEGEEEEEEEEVEEEILEKKENKAKSIANKENDKAADNTKKADMKETKEKKEKKPVKLPERRSARIEGNAKEARRTKAAKVPKKKTVGGQSREDRKFWKAAFA